MHDVSILLEGLLILPDESFKWPVPVLGILYFKVLVAHCLPQGAVDLVATNECELGLGDVGACEMIQIIHDLDFKIDNISHYNLF